MYGCRAPLAELLKAVQVQFGHAGAQATFYLLFSSIWSCFNCSVNCQARGKAETAMAKNAAMKAGPVASRTVVTRLR